TTLFTQGLREGAGGLAESDECYFHDVIMPPVLNCRSSYRRRSTVLIAPFGAGFDAAKREHVDLRDQAIRIFGLVSRNLVQNVGRLERNHQLGKVHRATLQNAQRWPDATGNSELDQRLQLGRTCDTDVDWQRDTVGLEALGPLDHRLRFERE